MYLAIILIHTCDGALASWNLLLNFSHYSQFCWTEDHSFILSFRPSPHPPSLCLIFLRANLTWTHRCPSDRPPPSLSSLWQRLPTTRTTKWRQIPRKLLTSPDRSANWTSAHLNLQQITWYCYLLWDWLNQTVVYICWLCLFILEAAAACFSPSVFFFCYSYSGRRNSVVWMRMTLQRSWWKQWSCPKVFKVITAG